MPSKLRLVVRFDGGSFRIGGQAKDYIRKYAVKYGMKEPITWKEYVKTVEDLPFRGKEILVLREPRRVDAGRSRYMNICGKYGLRGARARVPEWNPPARTSTPLAGMVSGPNGMLVPASAMRVNISGTTFERVPGITDVAWRRMVTR